MPVKTEGYDADDSEGLYVLLKFTYTAKYPEEAAVLEVEESDEAGEDGLVEELLEHLGQQVRGPQANEYNCLCSKQNLMVIVLNPPSLWHPLD